MRMDLARWFKRSLIIITCPLLGGCGILIGNVRPVEEKAANYRYLNLSENNSAWKRLPSAQDDGSDVTFQSNQTQAIISLNSTCKSVVDAPESDLQEVTRLLLLGMSDVTEKKESSRTVSDLTALETTVQGKLAGEKTKIRALVLQKTNCVYDLMYVSRPEKFVTHEADFSRFIEALRIL